MPRTASTLDDRARKARIRENEYRSNMIKLRKLDEITDEQIATLKNIKAAEATGKTVNASTVPDWRALREMGVVKESDGVLTLSGTGATVATSDEKKKRH